MYLRVRKRQNTFQDLMDKLPDCNCFKCSTTEYKWFQKKPYKRIQNNLHGRLCECPDCGHLLTEYVDHYTWGEYKCWWCEKRASNAEK